MVQQQGGERNFHSFYQVKWLHLFLPFPAHHSAFQTPFLRLHVLQLLRGGSEEMLHSLHLQNDPALYLFTREGAAAAVSSPSSRPICPTVLLAFS